MNLSNFTNMVEIGANNPECAFFVGSMTGTWTNSMFTFYYVLLALTFVVLMKLVSNITQLCWDKLMQKIKRGKNVN